MVWNSFALKSLTVLLTTLLTGEICAWLLVYIVDFYLLDKCGCTDTIFWPSRNKHHCEDCEACSFFLFL